MNGMPVNEQTFRFNRSAIPEANSGKQVVVLDSGFTFSQIPPVAEDFIYGRIPGATFNQTSRLWNAPCNGAAELIFQFGYVPGLLQILNTMESRNVAYPVHQLYITRVTTDGV